MKLFRTKKNKECNHKFITLETHDETGCIKCGIKACKGIIRIRGGA